MQVGGRTEGPERDLSGPPETYPASLVASACRWIDLLGPLAVVRHGGRLAGDVLDLPGGPLEDLADLLEELGFVDRLGGEAIGSAADVAEGEVDLVHRL